MSEPLMVLVTTATTQDARRLARTLVQEGLAACANLVPVTASIYAWKGEICEEEETLMVMESTRDRFAALSARVATLHDYDVPKIVGLPIAEIHEPYLQWLLASVTRPIRDTDTPGPAEHQS